MPCQSLSDFIHTLKNILNQVLLSDDCVQLSARSIGAACAYMRIGLGPFFLLHKIGLGKRGMNNTRLEQWTGSFIFEM